MSDRSDLEAAVEAILFAAGEPVTETRLLAAFDESEREGAKAALAVVLARYEKADGRGVFAEEVAGGYRLATRAECHPFLKKFFEASGASKLTMAALETLAIVAYRQPITGPEIQELRGKSSASVLKTLLERRMIRITGRKDVVGRPFVYATTREFLLHFGLRSLEELPPLEEFEESFGEGAEGVGATTAATTDREEAILREAAALESVETGAGDDALASSAGARDRGEA